MKQFKNTILIFIFLVALYSVLRLGFFLANRDFFYGIETGEILWAFVLGIRFDCAGILIVNLPVTVGYMLPYKPLQWLWYRTVLFILFIVTNLAGILLNIADYGYYPTVQRRLIYEPYTMFSDILRMVPSLLIFHFVLAGVFLLSASAFVFLCLKFFKLIRVSERGTLKFVPEFVAFLLVSALSVVGIRGGVQLKPIRQTNAFFSSHACVGYLTLNSTYTVVRSLFQESLPRYEFLPEVEARALVGEMLFSRGDSLIDPEYPFFRQYTPEAVSQKRNVVIILMESWSAQSLGIFHAKNAVTPFFDSLCAHGTLFTNFIANGQRSVEAVPAVLTSIPALFNASLIGSKEELDHFRGLGAILSEAGYTTSFHHGATLGSMGLEAFSKIAGFARYFSKEDTEGLNEMMLDGVWGVYDEPFFLESARRIGTLPQPFCSVIFSLSSHDPFHLPSGMKRWAEQYKTDSEFELSLRYSDYSLSKFFEKIRTEPWFNNTIFLITGDHTFFATRNNQYEAFHIPLLVYQPLSVERRTIPNVGSQVDMLPTILDLLKLPARHASMGRSLFDSVQTRYAVVKFGPVFIIFDDRFAYAHDLDKSLGLFRYLGDPFFKENMETAFPKEAFLLKQQLFAYLQMTTTTIGKDRIVKNIR